MLARCRAKHVSSAYNLASKWATRLKLLRGLSVIAELRVFSGDYLSWSSTSVKLNDQYRNKYSD